MTFTCDRCQRRYSIGDDKVRGRTVKIRCKNCQNVITVEGPAAEESTKMMTITEVEQLRQKQHVPAGQSLWENEATKATPALDMSVQWHAMIQGQQSGPFNIATLGGKVSSGEVTLRTYVWRKGMPDWKRASDLPEMAILFAGGNVAKSPVAPAPVSRRPTGAMPAITAAQPHGMPQGMPPAPRPTGQWAVASAPAKAAEASSLAGVLADPPWVAEPRGPASNGAQRPSPGDELEELLKGFPERSTEPHPAANGTRGSVEAEGAEHFDAEPTDAKRKKKQVPAEDPFAALGALDPAKLPPAGESTSFFIAQAGVNKRNPPWKIALFVIALIGLPTAALYALSTLKVVPLEVTRVDESGREVKESVFSAEGVSGLKDLLLGRHKKPPPEKVVATVHAAGPARSPGGSGPTPTVGAVAKVDLPKGLSREDMKSFYGKQEKGDVGPHLRAGVNEQAKDTGGQLTQDQISKVVTQIQPAFQNCIEQGLKRNPGFRGGKVMLTATVASSGVVKKVEMDRQDLSRTDIGECVKERAKRMVFPTFAGDEVDVEIPLLMGVTM